jgi:hypothetical protein
MKRLIIALLLWPMLAFGHVGSPDVFFEGDAGPYRLFVTVRTPQVIPGVATIEIRSESPDVRELDVVPMRLTGPGSDLPPTADHATRSPVDPKFFTADLWLMERGSLQVRITARGDRGAGKLAVPVPAYAQTTLAMTRGLGTLLFALMVVLALAIVGIVAGAVREAALQPDAVAPPAGRKRARIVTIVAGAAVVGVLALGNLWWTSEADAYARQVMRPWQLAPQIEGCQLRVPRPGGGGKLLPDHGHLMHLFVVRDDLGAIAHLHPEDDGLDDFIQRLPPLPAGRYRLFADVVFQSGFPITGTGTIELPALSCDPPAGDDSTWTGAPPHGDISLLASGARMIWDHPHDLRAGSAMPLRFRVETADGKPAELEPYMGMAGHAVVVRPDGTVFAHLHPAGSVAMPALDLARGALEGMPGMMHSMPASASADLAFPYGFPRAGDYRIFVQVKHAGVVQTGVFDAHVE